jgi:hypothetical protein
MLFHIVIMAFVLMGLTRAYRAGSPMKVAKNFMSLRAGAVPESEEMKAFYALGINVAKQVGGELKGTDPTHSVINTL